MNNNLGSNPYDAGVNGYDLTPRDLAILASDVNREGTEETSFDDLFDDPSYRMAQTTFRGQSHKLMPQGQTYYREAVQYADQGIPVATSTAHWDWIPAQKVAYMGPSGQTYAFSG